MGAEILILSSFSEFGGPESCHVTHLASGVVGDRFRKTSHSRNAVVTVLITDDPCGDACGREINPEESALETKMVVKEDVVKTRTSMPKTSTEISAATLLLLRLLVLPRLAAGKVKANVWEIPRKCDSHVVASSG